jgi:NADH-quinone oxidoreductase subunit N
MNGLPQIQADLLNVSESQLRMLSPYLWMLGGITLVTVAAVSRWFSSKSMIFGLSIATLIATILSSMSLLGGESVLLFNRAMAGDAFSNFFNILFAACAGLTLLASSKYLDREGLNIPEYSLLVLFSTLGMMCMTAALDFITLFIALELMSLTVYLLVGFRRSDRKSNEAAMKYFILGGAASAVFLYGTALLYGATGTTNIRGILEFVQAPGAQISPLFTVGSWFVIAGFMFKVASVPFHMWMPDVYEGAPTTVTGFMTTGLKAASFATFLRVFISLGYGKGITQAFEQNAYAILWVCAVGTMVIGNFVALSQTNLKRMLAYSSIAHTGYILVGLIAGSKTEYGYAPLVLYLVGYSVMNMGAFVILTILASKGDERLNLSDLSGLSKRHPWLAFAMAVFLFSMAGVPPTAGFVSKYLLFYGAVQAGEIPLVVISVLCSAVSVYYYLRVLVYMYMREPVGSEPKVQVAFWPALAVAAMVVLTFQFGILPAQILELARLAVTSL